MRFTALVFSFLLLSAHAFAAGKSNCSDTSKSACLESANRRLDEAFQLMQKHYYKKDAVNWDSLLLAAKNRLTTSENCDEVLETVNWCFQQMSERHSFIMPAKSAAVYTNDTTALSSAPPLSKLVGELKGELLTDNEIAYLNLPWVSSADLDICTKIADSIQGLIKTLDSRGINKWIIDLRSNTGGNCWPMIAGIGPLLGEGICGYFVTENKKLPISYQNGAAMQGKQVRCKVTTPYKTRFDKHWIIVLTGPKTSSSGEIVALAFKGKEQALLYGQPTAGFTTANATYPLSDKSLLVLTVCMEADRTGKVYDGSILPDQFVRPDSPYPHDDPAKSAAIMWLQTQ